MKLFLYTALGLLLLITFLPSTQAAYDSSCAQATATLGVSTRIFTLYPTSAGGCGAGVVNVGSGSSISLRCEATTTGAVPPGAPTSVNLGFFTDDGGFPSSAPGGAGTIYQESGTFCSTLSTHTFYCTSNGLVGGSPRYGMVRIFVQAIKSTIPTYDVNSDSGTWGSIRCTPDLTAFTYTPAYTLYTGDDSLTHSATVDSSAYNTGRAAVLRVKCNSLGMVSTLTTGTTNPSQSATISTGTAYPAFPPGCNMRSGLSLTANSAISGATTLPYSIWNAAAVGTISNGSRDVDFTTSSFTSYQWNMTAVNAAKTAGGANVSSFILGTDQEFVKAFGLKNPRNEFGSGKAVTCTRLRPDLVSEVGVSMGNTDASGNTGSVEFPVNSPAGLWTITCAHSTSSGNSATYSIQIAHLSSLTSDVNIAIAFNITNESGVRYVNITALTRTVDTTCDCVVQLFPDGALRLTLAAYNTSALTYTDIILNRSSMTQITDSNNMLRAAFYAKVVINDSNLTYPLFAWTTGNLTSRPFLSSATYLFPGDSVNANTTPAYNGNFTGNFTGNMTILSAIGQVVLQTSIDSWVPLVIWGGLFIFFLWYVAWAPAIGALLGLTGALLGSIGNTMYPQNAATMVFIILLAAHVIVTRSINPTLWGRKET